MIPCFIGGRHPAFVRLAGPGDGRGWNIRALTHPGLRQTARVRALLAGCRPAAICTPGERAVGAEPDSVAR